MIHTELENSKPFMDGNEIAISIYNLLKKEFDFEFNCLDTEKRHMEDVQLVPCPGDPTIVKLKGHVLLPVDPPIHPSSVITKGYNAGRTCKIIFYAIEDQFINPHLFIQDYEYKVTGYITFAKPICRENEEICGKVDVTVDIPYENNDNITLLDFYLHNVTKESMIMFQCTPTKKIPYKDDTGALEKLSGFWKSELGQVFLSILTPNFTFDGTFRSLRSNNRLFKEESLDKFQKDLARAICCEKKIINCLAPAGCGKTQSLSSALLTATQDRRMKYLVVGPTNKSCEAIMDRLNAWAPDTRKILYIKSRHATVRHPDKTFTTETYYKKEGIGEVLGSMSKEDAEKYNAYIKHKDKYGKMKFNKSSYCLTKSYFNTMNDMKCRFKNAEASIPNLIMDYIKPQIIVCTIDIAISGLHKAYTEEEFTYVIIDEASQVRIAAAIALHNKYPDSCVCYLGDLNQLPPYELFKVDIDEKEKLLSQSILQLFKRSCYSTNLQLCLNYRSHPRLVNMVSELFYDGKLTSMKSNYKYHFTEIRFIKCKYDNDYFNFFFYPFYMFDIKYPSEKHDSGSIYNVYEARDIATLVLYFYLLGYDSRTLGIACMYKAQVNETNRAIKGILDDYENQLNISLNEPCTFTKTRIKNFIKSLVIDTVDAFQGNEKEFMIISTSRSLKRKDDIVTDFFELGNRLCVALTRAKTAFFLFGDSTMMEKSDTWNLVKKYMEQRNTIMPFSKYVLSKIFPWVEVEECLINRYITS